MVNDKYFTTLGYDLRKGEETRIKIILDPVLVEWNIEWSKNRPFWRSYTSWEKEYSLYDDLTEIDFQRR